MTTEQRRLVDIIAAGLVEIDIIEKSMSNARLKLQEIISFDDEHKYEAKEVFRYMEQNGIR